MNTQPLTVMQIFSALGRHKVKVFFTWLMVMALVLAAFVIWPRKYMSEGRLYVKMDRNNTSVKPSSTGNQVSIQDTRETEIRSVVEIIHSRAVLDAVVDEIGAEEILSNGLADMLPKIALPSFGTRGSDGDMTAEEYEAHKKKEQAVIYLGENMNVVTEKKTSIIYVDVNANSARLAQRICDSIFRNTRRVHLKIHGVSSSAKFFNEQFELQQAKLVDAVQKLADFRNEKKVLSVGAARDSAQSIYSMLENNLVTAEINLKQSEERLAKLKELKKSTKAQIELPKRGVERLSYEDSRTELFKLEAEKERLLSLYRPGHPEVIRVQQQVETLTKTLEGMTNDRTESMLESNPVYEALEIDVLKAQAEFAANEKRVQQLKKQRSMMESRLESLNQAEVTADQLTRDVDVARQYLAIFTQKRGESQAMEKHDALNISDVVVWQTPSLAAKHRTPRGSLVLPLGCLAGMFSALAVALYADRNHLAGSLNESEVEQVLELPVLVTLPRVYSSRNMVN